MGRKKEEGRGKKKKVGCVATHLIEKSRKK
jgi:hypothetical protein